MSTPCSGLLFDERQVSFTDSGGRSMCTRILYMNISWKCRTQFRCRSNGLLSGVAEPGGGLRGLQPPPPLWGVGGGLSPTTFSEASGGKTWVGFQRDRPWTPASVQSFNGRVSPPTFFSRSATPDSYSHPWSAHRGHQTSGCSPRTRNRPASTNWTRTASPYVYDPPPHHHYYSAPIIAILIFVLVLSGLMYCAYRKKYCFSKSMKDKMCKTFPFNIPMIPLGSGIKPEKQTETQVDGKEMSRHSSNEALPWPRPV